MCNYDYNNDTLEYYNTNAKEYFKNTVSVDFEEKQNMLLKYLKPGSHILDFGCGSGRDSKAFKDNGFIVTSIDGSIEMCKIASDFLGQEVIFSRFDKLNQVSEYDAVWACASLLHLPFRDLCNVIKKISTALKPDGYFYASFKYGDYEGEKDGRYFTYLTEPRLKNLIEPFKELEIIESKITNDVRLGYDEKWLNVILIKF